MSCPQTAVFISYLPLILICSWSSVTLLNYVVSNRRTSHLMIFCEESFEWATITYVCTSNNENNRKQFMHAGKPIQINNVQQAAQDQGRLSCKWSVLWRLQLGPPDKEKHSFVTEWDNQDLVTNPAGGPTSPLWGLSLHLHHYYSLHNSFSLPWFSIWTLNECPSLNNLLTYPDVVMLEEELQVRHFHRKKKRI